MKYIKIEELEKKQYLIIVNDSYLGFISYVKALNKHIFTPFKFTTFKGEWLREIADFIKEKNED